MTLLALAPSLLLAGAGGGALLRRAWADRDRRTDLRLAGWALPTAALLLSAVLAGPVRGIAVALVLLPIGALAVVASGMTRRAVRAARQAQLAPEPLDGVSRAWRGWLKALLAGPLGMFAAMGVAFCYASWAPGAVQTRLLIAALLVPGLWGLAMTWTLADQRILRATAVLGGTIVGGFGLAFLRGIA
ncbi:hypothetical protein [Sphingomonas sp. MMS24-J13]|uniref:hypothetical protein n=1 Tax=Sphingomonas sp. MMS24-J13 TaxID=3238686 RepID=UPI00384C6AA1